MKRKNFLTSFCLSALFLLLGNAGWAQEPAYQTGFEASEGFTASTTYNNNDIVYFGNSGEQWGTYYGTASTTSPITGGQSMQMRWYSANADRIGYTFTNFDIANATKVVFKAKNTNGINVICSFSSDGGATYMGEETFTLDGNPGEYTYNISATGAYANVRVKFQITYTTAPTATSRLIIDDVRIYAAAGPDETAPTFASGYPTTANVLFTSLDALVKTDEPCTVYYKVVADGATAPTVDEVIDNNETITVAAANTEYSSSITGLTAETAYDIYFVAKDAAENTQATATKVDVTTLTADTKILTLTAPIGGESYNTGENATITWTSYNCESENIKIELYLPQDGNWSELVSSTTNDGSETITIPSDATYATNYKLRISLVSDATINSTSEDFTVLSVISIYNIQYTTAADGASPLVDQIVTTTGIVTAVNWNSQYNNGDFIIQDGTGLYSAIYAFRCATQVAIGDLVMVTGPVVEYNGLTEIGTNGNVAVATILSSGNTVPAPIEVTTLAANGEGYESMLVKVSNATYDGTALNDGSGSLNFYNKFGISSTPVAGNSYNVTGVILCHTSGPQIAPRTNDDVESLGGGGGGDETITPIYDIQYTTAADGASPLVNQTVTTTGIVTAVNWNDNYNNGDFTIQDGTGLYSAIYAFRCATQVAIGDLVKVTGPVVEYNGLTEIGTSGNVAVATILSSGNTVPEPIEVSTLDANGEGYESMLVKVSNVVCDGTVLNDGSGSLNYYNKFGVDYTFEETIHYDIIGIILCHTSGPQICPRTTSDISITNDVEVNPFDTFSAYPNPFNNEIRFAGSDVKRVTIVSVVGSVLYDKTVADNELINTSDIPSGIYLVRFTNSLGQSTVKKMIKK